MGKTEKFLKDEKGNVLILFAGSFIFISFFIGLLIDISMIYMDNNSMQNQLQIIREERFVHQDTIRYSDNPAKDTYEIVRETARKNGFGGQVKVYFKEEKPDRDKSFRSYKVRVVLRDQSEFYFGKLFKLNTISLSAKLDGGESYGDGSTDIIWYPEEAEDVPNYNGLYCELGHKSFEKVKGNYEKVKENGVPKDPEHPDYDAVRKAIEDYEDFKGFEDEPPGG